LVIEPWERQPKESEQAFGAFRIYRDMLEEHGARSLREVARTLHKPLTTLGEWSKKHGWVERAAAFDRDVDRRRREQDEHDLVRARRRSIEQVRTMRETVFEVVASIAEDFESARRKNLDPLAGVTTAEKLKLAAPLFRAWQKIVETVRLLTGQSTENVAVREDLPVQAQVDAMTPRGARRLPPRAPS